MCAKHWLEFQYGDKPPPPQLVALIEQAGPGSSTSDEGHGDDLGPTGGTVDSLALGNAAAEVEEDDGDGNGLRGRGVRSSLTKPTLDTIVEAEGEGDQDSPSTSSGSPGSPPNDPETAQVRSSC